MLLTLGVAFPAIAIAACMEMDRDRRETDEWIKQFRDKFGPKA